MIAAHLDFRWVLTMELSLADLVFVAFRISQGKATSLGLCGAELCGDALFIGLFLP
jgi:hypothetical protein